MGLLATSSTALSTLGYLALLTLVNVAEYRPDTASVILWAHVIHHIINPRYFR
jgi:hypothetical protein